MKKENMMLCKIKDKKALRGGFTLIETLIVMAMLAILGTVLVSLVASGGKQFQHLQKNYQSENEARIALSYITVKIRQNDVMLADNNSGVQLVGSELQIYRPLSEGGYWQIYYDNTNGELREKLFEHNADLLPISDQLIAEGLSGLALTFDENSRIISIAISYQSDIGTRTLSEQVHLRSELE